MPRMSILAAVAALALAGCGDSDDSRAAAVDRVAVAPLQSAPYANVTGAVVFVQTGPTMQVFATVDGLTPGKHGFHVHERGECTSPDFESAGGHFTPGGHAHGAPEDDEHHEGDFGNIVADANGHATIRMVVDEITLEPAGDRSVVGRALVIHASEDDLESQPSGNAGARVACARILLVDTPQSAT